jgi:hypothetical protein
MSASVQVAVDNKECLYSVIDVRSKEESGKQGWVSGNGEKRI